MKFNLCLGSLPSAFIFLNVFHVSWRIPRKQLSNSLKVHISALNFFYITLKETLFSRIWITLKGRFDNFEAIPFHQNFDITEIARSRCLDFLFQDSVLKQPIFLPKVLNRPSFVSILLRYLTKWIGWENFWCRACLNLCNHQRIRMRF